ncbi:hypothetical protein [Thioalkalivibrio sp. ALJ8]|uniref:hypothetical protein n=1 Tax=Thioalkalivibrio sp. ALJ8 TaxID=1158757 RepID=UPI0003815A70|nr:hypothetical protein [Thioalkalivibrio sp. ALJ8]
MKIYHHVPDQDLEAHFRGHDFSLDRDDDDRWYMIVKNADGSVACDGWIEHSECMDEREAMIAACEGAEIAPPKRWPKQIGGAS